MLHTCQPRSFSGIYLSIKPGFFATARGTLRAFEPIYYTMNSVLVIGGPKSGKKTVVQDLQHLVEGDVQGGEEVPSSSILQCRSRLALSNKYYDANLTISTVMGVPFEQISTHTEELAHVCDGLQGVIAVVDLLRPDSLDDVESWVPFLDQVDPEIKLLVSVTTRAHHPAMDKGDGSGEDDTNGDRGHEHSVDASFQERVEDWCAENMFEYIDSSRDTKTRDENGEKTGLSRVLEALQCHMWPDLDMHPAPRAGVPVTAGDSHGLTTEPISTGENAEQTPGTVQNDNQESAPGDGKVTAVNAGVNPQELDGTPNPLLKPLATAQLLDAAGPEGADELSDVERTMASLAYLRGHLATLDDDDRRTKAAEVALMFANMLGLDSDDDEDEGDLNNIHTDNDEAGLTGSSALH
eukprot:TRINITY_DN6555_c0_g1_i2.p1 TRINITY_DN6555_c0_g1~~TRINITY_DN6555_c0_g1_i2.p1  ORF type:complete len:409 (+),score=38.56 TRINITY_DN6555_c0_g1_i2:3-1229(+)